jgi:hypothetical protein
MSDNPPRQSSLDQIQIELSADQSPQVNALDELIERANIFSQIATAVNAQSLNNFQPLPFTDYSLFQEQYGKKMRSNFFEK